MPSKIERENREMVSAFLEDKRDVKELTEETLKTYAREYLDFLAMVGNTPLANVGERDVVKYITRPMTQKRPGRPVGAQVSSRTKAKRASEMNVMFAWFKAHGMIPLNPCDGIELGKKIVTDVHPFPDSVWMDLWASDLSPEDRVVFGLWEFCGLRRAESTKLRTRSVVGDELDDFWRKGDRVGHFSGHSPWLTNMQLFNEYRPDLLPDISVFALALEQVLSKGYPLVVSGWADEVKRRSRTIRHDYVNQRHANDRLKRALVRCGHPEDAGHPHQCRHSFGTVMKQDVRMDIEELAVLMNHADLNSTRIYIEKNKNPGERYLRGGSDLLAKLARG